MALKWPGHVAVRGKGRGRSLGASWRAIRRGAKHAAPPFAGCGWRRESSSFWHTFLLPEGACGFDRFIILHNIAC